MSAGAPPRGLPLSLPFSSLPTAASIFSLKEIQLQKDPGYRGLAFQQPGRGLRLPRPRPLLEETRTGCSSLLKNRVGNQHGLSLGGPRESREGTGFPLSCPGFLPQRVPCQPQAGI